MNESKIQENDDITVADQGLLQDHDNFTGFGCKNNFKSHCLCDVLKCCLLKFVVDRAEKLFIDKKLRKRISLTDGNEQLALLSGSSQRFSGENVNYWSSSPKNSRVNRECNFEVKSARVDFTLQENKRVCAISNNLTLVRSKNGFDGTNAWNDDCIDESEVANAPSGCYSEFPWNLIAFFATLFLRFIGFQFTIFFSFVTFPIWLSYLLFMSLMFPLQTLRHIRGYSIDRLLTVLGVSSKKVTVKVQKSVGKVAIRFAWAFLSSIYVFFMLIGLLGSGFLFMGFMMRNILEKPIHTTETLNFDYAKSSPVAFVPITPGVGEPSSLTPQDSFEDEKHVGARVIPYNHKLQLTVSLILPESEYNRKLGVFQLQVRVEFLSTNGKVTASSSYPCILQFKSEPIRYAETIVMTAPLIAGLRSESQVLEIKTNEFTEGLEPTACFKVIVEQRAEYKAGAGIPEIYAASLVLKSELPLLKRMIWLWRRTIFVWASFIWFLTELVFVLLVCRSTIMTIGRPRIAYGKMGFQSDNIPWYKGH
ncbi:Seipin domain-containing protein [Cephalotus follicularis]|uniref:Seipin domain-containing protein n=1 Tax=Cephalotus follicularis TaxID=3775 RepID=A0A1Q3AY62_CEPFO|nr:Seipin domain-containing protein [Cephalotus follicularis]